MHVLSYGWFQWIMTEVEAQRSHIPSWVSKRKGKDKVKNRLSVKVHSASVGRARERKGKKRDLARQIKELSYVWALVCSNTCSYYHLLQETGKLMQAGAWKPCVITLKHTGYYNPTHRCGFLGYKGEVCPPPRWHLQIIVWICVMQFNM